MIGRPIGSGRVGHLPFFLSFFLSYSPFLLFSAPPLPRLGIPPQGPKSKESVRVWSCVVLRRVVWCCISVVLCCVVVLGEFGYWYLVFC